ncbi:MAG: recombination factor protein RarA, partial [Gemmatimonadota bacterium]
EGYLPQDYLPDEVHGATFYEPGGHGFEKEIEKRMAWWRSLAERVAQGQEGHTPNEGSHG